MLKKILLLLVMLYTSNASVASEVGQVTGLPIPRFVTLKSSETNLRKGPNVKYPVVWNYKQKSYPLEIVAEFENWRKLRDIDGEEGWVHVNLITGARKAIIKDNKYLTKEHEYAARSRELVLFRYPDEDAYPMLRVELGVLASIKACNREWCKLKIDDITAWARKENLWGVYPEEVIE